MDLEDKLDNLDECFDPASENVHPGLSDFSEEAKLPSNSSEKMGECIIFNYEEYDKSMRLTPRFASRHDAESLEYVFKELEFNVHKYQSLSRSNTFKTLKEVSLNASEESRYFVCCILTHGDSTDRLATKDRWLDLDEFLRYFYPTHGNLIGKPKIFIIQACRGDTIEKKITLESTDLATSENELYPDFIIAYSTYPGKLAFKNSDCGSFYIQELCGCLEHFSKDQDFLQILTVVNYRMANFFESHSKHPYWNESTQMPNFTSTLKSQILFQKCIKPYNSLGRTIHNERRADSRLDKSGEKDPYYDLKSYRIPTAQNVQFSQILIKKGGPMELIEAAADLSVYIKEKKYQHGRRKCDLKKSEILEDLKSIASTDYKGAIDCMICFFATPCKREYLCDKGGRKISKQEVIETFVQNQHSTLVGKPKIFIFLMCHSDVRMESCDGVSSTERPDSYFTAEHADILSITISIKNRNHLLGPMKEFGLQLKNCGASENFLSLLTRINSILIEKYKFQNGNPRSTFSFNSTLTKNLFLP